jgi:predicted amidohydrolase
MPEIIRVAQIKVYPAKGDLEGNFAELLAILKKVQEHRPDVVVTPECFLDGYVATEERVTHDNITRYAIDPSNSSYVGQISAWASKTASWFVFGCTRLASEGAYNSAFVLNRTGDLVGVYDKVHCQTHDRKFTAGSSLPIFGSDFGLFGVMICADRRWPETVRTLALKGARVILNPTYGMHGEKNLHMMQTRSYESELFIVFTHPGQALITNPRGEIVQNETSAEVTFAITDIDLSETDRVRRGPSAHLRDRRTDLYQL